MARLSAWSIHGPQEMDVYNCNHSFVPSLVQQVSVENPCTISALGNNSEQNMVPAVPLESSPLLASISLPGLPHLLSCLGQCCFHPSPLGGFHGTDLRTCAPLTPLSLFTFADTHPVGSAEAGVPFGDTAPGRGHYCHSN